MSPSSNPNRLRIYAFIEWSPGTHLRELHRKLDIPMGTLEYHLRRLEESDRIVSRTIDRYKSYYPRQQLSPTDQDFLYYLRQGSPRRIVQTLMRGPEEGMAAMDVADAVGMARSTVTHHAKKLVAAGILAKSREGRRTWLHVADRERVQRLLRIGLGRNARGFETWFRALWAEHRLPELADAQEADGSDTKNNGPSRI